jgi:hypothetical protein
MEQKTKSSIAAAQQEVRSARSDLERWQAAYDGYRGDDPQKYHAEIRAAEQRLAAARQTLRGLREGAV